MVFAKPFAEAISKAHISLCEIASLRSQGLCGMELSFDRVYGNQRVMFIPITREVEPFQGSQMLLLFPLVSPGAIHVKALWAFL